MTARVVDRVRAGLLVDGVGELPLADVDVRLVDGSVASVAGAEQGSPVVVGGPRSLVLPALANAHDHGRGLSTLAFGAADQALETWLPALSLQPYVDPSLLATLAMCGVARSGVASVVHCHNTQRVDELVDECVGVAAAARAVGVRIAVAVPLADQHRLGYGPDEAVLGHVDPVARPLVVAGWGRPPAPWREQLATVDEVASRAAADGDPLVHVQYCPIGPQWCSAELLAGVAEASARTGRRVHMHLCETRYQREWADAELPSGLLPYLDGLGLLNERLTVAHAVWLDDDDLMLLAERRVVVSVNSGSNLRLRSGRARLRRMIDLGVRVASGLDGMSIDDDDDALRELQLTHLLHAGTGLEADVSATQVLRNSMVTGPVAVSGDGGWGAVVPGAPADLAVIDLDGIAGDVVPSAQRTVDDLAALVLARARSRHVTDLVVAGRHVVGGGRVLGVDEDAVRAEVTEACLAGAEDVAARAGTVGAYQDALRSFYRRGGHGGPVTS